ncbi:helix-turn-helix transcriptional regulator [Gandjariella thermophila]|uniref:Helix-turn-helix transcriptional regulator n=1 Tax=Gandjariella thermophila TaxID=1931992 RepID=A0A4D4J935_9PSEU|nr:LuxR C-terminal-related transcriptional regulator [Gandjariella thermophila]GDY31178.1 helix-turn-helix transcriptional regulator [Gandjariella thermophila]
MNNRAANQPKPILDRHARELLQAVEADPFAPLHVGVMAPGGYGKTRLLAELAQAYRSAGVDVAGVRQAMTDSVDTTSTALLVDDAHLLGEPQLDRLRRLAETEQIRLVVGYRPWPRPAGLSELTEVLGPTRQPLTLGPLDRDQIRELAGSSLGARPRPALVEFVQAWTGGVPAFAERLVRALAESGEAAREKSLEVPPAAIAAFRHDLDRLDPDVLRFLLAVEAGVGLHMDLLNALFGEESTALDEVMEAARATGLLGRDGALLPIGVLAVRALIPAERRIAVRQRLAELQLARGGSVLGLAKPLLGTGIGGASAAAAFEAAGEEAMADDPALAARFFAAAATAGGPVSRLACRWARAAALAGDLDSALRLADRLIAEEESPDRREGARIAATALAHRGQLGRSAELYRWAGSGAAGGFATVGLIGTGQLAGAQQLLIAAPPDDPPTLLSGAASLMAHGVHESVAGSATSALHNLVRSATLLEPAARGVLLPDSPAALAALVALHCGELNVAESVLDRAVAADMGGPLMAVRHRLLRAWIAMVRGQTAAAREHLAEAGRNRKTLEPRDWLFATALQAGLARRDSDVAALQRIWGDACEAIMRHPVDLFTFLPLGEFATAAARLRDQDRLVPHLHEANRLLAQLGNPPLWSAPLHWSGLHAAIIAQDTAAAKEHADALSDGGEHGRYRAVLAAAAACWVDVLTGEVDPGRVDTAAHGLHDAGLWWDAARLAGQAAIRTSDRKAMVSLLDCARLLQGRSPGTKAPAPATGGRSSGRGRTAADPAGTGTLSEREQEVARLVLAGLTYKQVGDRLFISAKTVEHHMARMRQRLGCTSRSELLDQLRMLLQEGPPG